MKKVTIPTCANPFVVDVNGKKYKYPAGTEQEVPDAVALIIEQHYGGHEENYPPVNTPFRCSYAETIGDISAALDIIIAMQNELIGGDGV